MAPGLKIECDGTMHGTPTAPGTFEFTVEASQYCAPDPKCFTQWGFTHKVRDKLNHHDAVAPERSCGHALLGPALRGRQPAAWAWAGRSSPARSHPGLTMVDGLPTARRAGRRRSRARRLPVGTYDVHRQGRRYRRLHARPLDDEAVHARRRRAVRGRTGAASSRRASSAEAYQRDARDGYRRPRPLHVDRRGRDDSARAHTRPRIGRSRRHADGGGLLLVLTPVSRTRTARPRTADASITVVSALDLVTTRARDRRRSASPYKATLRVARRSGAADVLRHRREAPGQAEAQREVRRHQREAEDSRHVPLPDHRQGRARPALVRAAALTVHA